MKGVGRPAAVPPAACRVWAWAMLPTPRRVLCRALHTALRRETMASWWTGSSLSPSRPAAWSAWQTVRAAVLVCWLCATAAAGGAVGHLTVRLWRCPCRCQDLLQACVQPDAGAGAAALQDGTAGGVCGRAVLRGVRGPGGCSGAHLDAASCSGQPLVSQ